MMMMMQKNIKIKSLERFKYLLKIKYNLMFISQVVTVYYRQYKILQYKQKV